MKFITTTFKQREYDGKWERLALVADEPNFYRYTNENGDEVTVRYTKWITIGVYDYLFDMENS